MFEVSVRAISPTSTNTYSHLKSFEDHLRPFLDRRINSYYYLLNSPKRPKSQCSSQRPIISPYPSSPQKLIQSSSPQKSDLMSTAGTKFVNKPKNQETPEIKKTVKNDQKSSFNQLQEQNRVYVNLYNKEFKRHEQEKKNWIQQAEKLEQELKLSKSKCFEQLLTENSELKKELEKCKAGFGYSTKILKGSDIS